jgi:hypothetical protein
MIPRNRNIVKTCRVLKIRVDFLVIQNVTAKLLKIIVLLCSLFKIFSRFQHGKRCQQNILKDVYYRQQ